MTRHPAVATLALCLLALASIPAASARQPARTLEPQLALDTFDRAWQLVDASPYDVRGKGVDWDAVRARHRPAAARASDMQTLRASILAMLEEIGESHFSLLPASVGEIADSGEQDTASAGPEPRETGLEVGIVEDRLAVLAVKAGSPADTAGIRSGWIIETLDGHAIGEVLSDIARIDTPELQRIARVQMEAALAARLGASSHARPVHLQLRDLQNHRREHRLVPARASGLAINMPLLPPLVFELARQRMPVADGGCIGLIRFNLWVPALATAFPEALSEVRDCHGIVIDLRGNPGGIIGTAMGVGGYLVDSPTPLGYMNAGGSSARLPALPRRVTDDGKPFVPYAGPIALLIDGRSASTSEIFAIGLQSAGRAAVFGSRSAGMALPSVMHPLPNGDQLMYAVADLTAPDGQRLEGHGIQPDHPAPHSLASLAAGRDNALQAARQWLLQAPARTSPREDRP